MAEHAPLDFLVARSAALSTQAAVLRDANAARHAQAEQVRRRAQAAVVGARLYAAYATDLVEQSQRLRRDGAPSTLDAIARERLAADELWRRRLSKRLRERDSG